MRSLPIVAFVMAAGLAASRCTTSANVAEALEVVDVTTGWFDAGIVEGGKNKLVPSISFRLQNGGGDPISSVQLNAVFRRIGEIEEWGSAYVRGSRQPLAPQQTSEPFVLRSGLGYTGTQPRAEMLQNREFVDANVQLFAKHGSAQWVKIGEYRVRRQLLTN